MIHPTAIIDPGARVAPSAKVGPYSIVGDEVEIGAESELQAHVYMQGPIRVGARNLFFPYSSIGAVPQDLKFRGERSETIIGDDNTFREFVTVQRGTAGGGGQTVIGNGCLVMAYTHIAHDCRIGDKVILGNGVTLAGHVVIQDFANVGAFSGVHQFCCIGAHALIGGYTVVTQDVMPFSRAVADRPVKAYGMNQVGLERRGFEARQMAGLHHAFRLLLSSKLNTTQALEQIRAEGPLSPEVQQLVAFIESSERGVIK